MAQMHLSQDGARIVICTGEGLTEIVVGPDGEEIQQLPHCPDCLLQALASGGQQPYPTAILATWQAAQQACDFRLRDGQDFAGRFARGPPALI